MSEPERTQQADKQPTLDMINDDLIDGPTAAAQYNLAPLVAENHLRREGCRPVAEAIIQGGRRRIWKQADVRRVLTKVVLLHDLRIKITQHQAAIMQRKRGKTSGQVVPLNALPDLLRPAFEHADMHMRNHAPARETHEALGVLRECPFGDPRRREVFDTALPKELKEAFREMDALYKQLVERTR